MLPDYKKLLEVAVSGATEAGKLIRDLRHEATAENKDDGSIVTNADKAAETLLRDHFEQYTPDIPVWGEEFGRTGKGADFEWIVDPIDGTTWYAAGSPIYGTLIGLAYLGEPVVGVIAMPATQELVSAAKGEGCRYTMPTLQKGQTIQVAQHKRPLIETKISSSGLHRSDISLEKGPKPYALSRLPESTALFRLFGDCIQHALVARGKIDGAIDTAMHPWDSAAIMPCITEAGGVVSGIDGQVDNILECGSLVSACHQGLLEEMVDVLKPVST